MRLIEYDPNKEAKNRAKHGCSLKLALSFSWDSSVEAVDERKPYGEIRVIAVGTILGRLHVIVYTRRADVYRIISVRKANKREQKWYEEYKKYS